MFLLRQSTHRMVVQYHSRIGYLYVPNLRARIPNELGGYYVRTNSQGFRADFEFAQKRTTRPRILFLGDSYTAGDGCSNQERFSELVGEALGAEVYNYGLSGSGTDQQLLIFEQFAGDVEADLIVLCVCVENIERIKVDARPSIDRVTGKRLLVPKPYFTMEQGKLCLNNVPVPRHRPFVESESLDTVEDAGNHRLSWSHKMLDFYRLNPKVANVRYHIRKSGLGSEFRSKTLRWSGFQPYPDYKDMKSRGWLLMQAILSRFVLKAAPTPVLLVPLPVYYFFLREVPPMYQKPYESLGNPENGIHVMDITTPLRRLPRVQREKLKFIHDIHFSPYGHRQVAKLIADEIVGRKLLAKRSLSIPVLKDKTSSSSQKAVNTISARKPTYILGLSCFYHDSAACLVKDGEIIAAAEEERFTRIKNDRRFPHHAANYCLEEGGIQQNDLAALVYYDNAPLTFERILHTQLAVGNGGEEAWLRVMPTWVRYKLHLPQLIRRYLNYEEPILHEVHHRSHAASAFYPSPYERAAILTVDGVGEWATASIGVGSHTEIQLLKEMRFPHSLGLLYSAFTQFTGFKVNSGEYKMMGLAPYGEPKYVDKILGHLLDLKQDGSIELNMEYFAFLSEPSMTNERFAQLFGGPARTPESRITQREMDIARSIQMVIEEAMLRMARYAHQLTGEKKLCLAGGVALNCVANGRLLREGPFEDIWIQPAAGDAGCALGAALDVYHNYFKKPRPALCNGRPLQKGSYWGPGFSEDEIRAFLNTHGYPYHHLGSCERAVTLARLLEEGKVIGHFSGKTEFGPRALGARSILGDARNEKMQVTLNLKIKYRESFRPFAPTVLSEKVADYFELKQESPYMLLVTSVNKARRKPFDRPAGDDLLAIVRQPRSDIPAVTHVDYSARVQTINSHDHPEYYDLLRAFEQLTGCATIVNTSFNVRGEPIVCTPYDAYRCFMRTEMDVLILGNYLLLKEEQPTWPESKGHVEENNHRLEKNFVADLFVPSLRKIFTSQFLPIARRLKDKNSVQVSIATRGLSSTWVDYAAKQTPDTIFQIPSALDSTEINPREMSKAITQYWKPGAATDSLRSVLEELLKLSQKSPEPNLGKFEEEVSDSMYVMY